MDNKNTIETPNTQEYLSAFLDDEAGDFERRRLLDEVQKDDALQQKVANFSLIGEAMRNENSSVTVRPNFLAGIHEQLEAEPAYHQVHIKPAANQPSWIRPITGMAVAASLVAAVVIAMNGGLNTSNEQQVTLAALQASNEDISSKSANVTSTKKNVEFNSLAAAPSVNKTDTPKSKVVYSAPNAAWRKRLKGYVDSHAKYASTSAIMPSVRAVSYASSY